MGSVGVVLQTYKRSTHLQNIWTILELKINTSKYMDQCDCALQKQKYTSQYINFKDVFNKIIRCFISSSIDWESST